MTLNVYLMGHALFSDMTRPASFTCIICINHRSLTLQTLITMDDQDPEDQLLKTVHTDDPGATGNKAPIVPDKWYAIKIYEVLTLELKKPTEARPYEVLVAWRNIKREVHQLNFLVYKNTKVVISDYGRGHNRGSIRIAMENPDIFQDMERGTLRVNIHIYEQGLGGAALTDDVTKSLRDDLPEDDRWMDELTLTDSGSND